MQGIQIAEKSKLDDWKHIFKYWHEELDTVIELCDGLDAPYIHAEHGSTHHFGVSASKCGLGTIREVIGKRNGGDARLDLCVVSNTTVDIIEAKWLEFECKGESPIDKISNYLNNACDDAGSYKNSHSLFKSKGKIFRRSGILFISPYFKDEINRAAVNNLIDDISSSLNPDVLVWSFPERAENLRYWERTYPGTIAVARCNDN